MKNKKIKIFNTTYTVEFVESIDCQDSDEFRFGECDAIRKIIRISTKDIDGNNFDTREMKMTLFHEIFHAIMSEGCYFDESDNEPFVEWCARCMFDLNEQGLFNGVI